MRSRGIYRGRPDQQRYRPRRPLIRTAVTAGGLSATVNQASETDTAGVITAIKKPIVARIIELEFAQPISPSTFSTASTPPPVVEPPPLPPLPIDYVPIAVYRYLAYDLLTNRPKASLPLSNVSFGSVLNDAGSVQANISARHSKATTDNLTPGLTAIYIERNGSIVWGGILWRCSVQSGTEQATLSLTGNDFFSYFQEINNRGRYIRHTLDYQDADQLQIARSLIDYAQNTALHGPSASLGIVTGTELTTDFGGVQELRTRTYYDYERKNIGSAITDLSALDNGFEFLIDSAYGMSTIVRTFRLYYPAITDMPGIVFRYPTNILSYTIPENASTAAKKVDGLGAGEGAAMLIETVEDTSLGYYPMREATFAYKDISVPETLTARVTADLQRIRLPSKIPTLVCRVNTEELRPGAFRCGANVRVVIKDGYTQIDAPYRIVQFEVRTDEDGNENMTVRLNASDVIGTGDLE